MKKIIKLFSVCSIILVTVLLVQFLDEKQSSSYANFPGYETKVIELPKEISVSELQMTKMEELSNKYGLIIMGQHYDNSSDSLQNFINVDTEDLVKILGIKYKNLDKSNTKSMEIATYDTGKMSQTGRLYDFLDNKRIEYFSFNQINEKGIYPNMMYIVYYKQGQEIGNYIRDLLNVFEVDQRQLIPENAGVVSGTSDIICMFIGIGILTILLFYFVLQIFMIYNMSHDLGALRLLGIEKKKILFIIEKENIITYIVTSMLMFVLCMVFARNMSFLFMSIVLGVYMALLLLLYLVSYLALSMILSMNKLGELLKYRKLTNKLTKISMAIKVLFSVLIFIIIGCLFEMGIQYYQGVQQREANRNILDYSVFYSVSIDNNQAEDMERYLELYKELSNSDIEFYYSDFNQYVVLEQDELYIQSIENKEIYQFAIVDSNFIQKQNMIFLDEKGNEIQLNPNTDVFLVPFSKKADVQGFKAFYKNEYNESYKEKNQKIDIQIIYYKDQSIQTFKPYLEKVDSPILHMITPEYPFSAEDPIIGLTMAGMQFDTPLSIKIDKQSEQQLFEIINKVGLDKALTSRNHYSYSDYYNDNLNFIRNTILVALGLFVVVLCIYMLISYEFVTLSIEDEKNVILVKYLLGMDKNTIFKKIYLRNYGMMIATAVISIAIYYVMDLRVYDYLLATIVLVFDYIGVCVFTGRIKINKVAVALKGGECL